MNHDEAPLLAGMLFCAAVCSLPATALGADLNLTLQAVETSEGTLRIAIYASERDFRKSMLRGTTAPAVAGDTRVTVEDLPVGDYAVLVYQDLNDNDKLDTNLLGIPNEPWGGSVNSKSTFGPPTWRDARFTLLAGGGEITIEMSGAE